MSEKRKIQRFNLDEGRIWEAIEGLSPFKTTYTLEEVCEKLNEQQATIKKLQDLNKKWKEMDEQLREINKEIGDELKLWQDVHKEYDIYNINDFEELMKSIK